MSVTMTPLTVRKLADRSTGTREVRFDPVTGLKKLVNPATPGEEHEPWPLMGVEVVGDVPAATRVPTRWVARGISEGWLQGIGGNPVVRPAGPAQTDWNSSQTGAPHMFMHYDRIVIKAVTGDVVYRVTHQPDKYVADGADDASVTPELYAAGETRVDHFYDLVLEG